MALVKCPECGRDVSDMAEYCINCGFPISEELSTIRYDINEFNIEGTTIIKYLRGCAPTAKDIEKMLLGKLDSVEFYKKIELNDIFIPYGITQVGRCSFFRCRTLGNIHMPDTVIEIEEEAFYSCGNIKKIEMSKNIVKIDNYAFCGCEDLETLVLPDGLINIGIGCFYRCESLKNINIPSSVTHIGSLAFKNTPNLKKIYISSNCAHNIKELLRNEYPEKQIIETN